MNKKEIMSSERVAASLAVPDLTDPKNGIHAINLVIEKIRESLSKKEGRPIPEIRRTNSPISSVTNDFDRLYFPSNSSARSSVYTRYITEEVILRTHTTAMIPDILIEIRQKGLTEYTVLCPGICYRRDVIDKKHTGEPHQMDIWRVKKGEPRLERPALIELIETVINSLTPGIKYRANEVKHPYTVNGLEVEILVKNNWLELLECGEAHPKLLTDAGLDPRDYSGLAMGMGLDRAVMIVKDIDDIRVLRSNDPRIKKQMTNLDKFVMVSNQPPTKRVLSYSASADRTEEDICEMIRDELGPNVIYIEEIGYKEILYTQLSDEAKKNLGIHPNQKNIVVTLIFRSLERSLPREQVNDWVQKLYPKLNEGDRGYM